MGIKGIESPSKALSAWVHFCASVMMNRPPQLWPFEETVPVITP
jgi:hypothetical protein